jgi:ubiquitin carboxyl-terminal hydrolase 4/11/15
MKNQPSIIPPKPPTPKEEWNYIEELRKKLNREKLEIGQTWYLLNSKWWNLWKKYTSYNSSSNYSINSTILLGPIDNNELIDPETDGIIKRKCIEPYDFITISEEVWMTLQEW